jgi:hypothetical protein
MQLVQVYKQFMSHNNIYVLWNICDADCCYISQSLCFAARQLGIHEHRMYTRPYHKDWRVRKFHLHDITGVNLFLAEFTKVETVELTKTGTLFVFQ